MSDDVHRVLPGNLVTFLSTAADVTLVRATQKKPRTYDNARDWVMADAAQKNRMADMLEAGKAVSCKMIYFALAASKKRTLLLRSDTLQMLVALTEDVRNLSRRVP